jgi:hypothetical protein
MGIHLNTLEFNWARPWSRGGPTTMTTRHRQGSFCAGLPLILFANTHLHFLFKQACMVVRA